MEKIDRQEVQTHETAPLLWQSPDWYRATTLTERIATLPPGASPQVPTNAATVAQAQRRLHRWQTQAPFDKSTLFAQRLALDGLSEANLLALLAEPAGAIQARISAPPAWLVHLQEAFAALDSTHDVPLPPLPAAENVAFAYVQLIQPLLQHGLKRLEDGVQNLLARYPRVPFDPRTLDALLFAHLAHQLAPKVSRSFVLELNVARLQGHLSGETAEARFQSYLQLLCEPSHLQSLLQEYCVLARQVVTCIDQWVNFSLVWLGHLCADWPALGEVFMPDSEPGMLTAVTAGMDATGDVSVTHQGGLSILILTFSSGWRLVYKPRSLAVDLHFQQLLSWLNARGQQPAFRTLKLLDRGSYGWSEFVTAASCRTEQEVARFYERHGAYLALLYVLGAANLQAEDIIAAGEYPMLVNLGTLFQSRVAQSDAQQLQHPADYAFNESVLRVGMLSNVPDTAYCDYVVNGFTTLYHLLIKHRDELLTTMLPRFAHDEIRFLARPTKFYTLLLANSFHPDILRDALLRDRYFDRLWVTAKERAYLIQLIAAEQADMQQNDIPLFVTYPDSRDLYTSQGAPIPAFFTAPGFTEVNRRLSLLSAENLTRQRWIIRCFFRGVSMSSNPTMGKRLTLQPSRTPVTGERLIGAACAVGERLASVAVQTDVAAAWFGMTIVKGGKWQLLPVGTGLYKGTAGIALFLAYLGHITGEMRYTLLAKSALTTVRIELQRQRRMFEATGIGAFDGLGASIYLFTHLAVLWNEPVLLQQARELVALLPDLIEKDDKLDILAGSAGCIVSLLGLYAVDPAPATLAAAVQCGDHLLTHAQQMQEGVGWCTSVGKIPLTGLSHGTAGIAWSLLSLAAVSGQARFRHTAQSALVYERSLFSPEKQNWPDLVPCSDPQEAIQATRELQYLHQWCHGAPGIGLARLASLPYLDDPQIREEIAIALKTTVAHGFGYNHSLCHGDFGNLEPLLVATQMLGHQQYREQVDQITAMLLDSIETDGWMTGIPSGAETPGLMNGLAGIGYALLRLATPDKVPSVLLLAPPCSGAFFPMHFQQR
ncbi:MAG TPA: type 2 lanthipeptide synthetase LanM family protein [Ktedonobacteraceae bacterium]|nr:type 2 lanthipeptide synthetase LanM family protein [Ktedonobacteraceae bacterium]